MSTIVQVMQINNDNGLKPNGKRKPQNNGVCCSIHNHLFSCFLTWNVNLTDTPNHTEHFQKKMIYLFWAKFEFSFHGCLHINDAEPCFSSVGHAQRIAIHAPFESNHVWIYKARRVLESMFLQCWARTTATHNWVANAPRNTTT